jgi:nicotinate-nucleotide adenylyltransferase
MCQLAVEGLPFFAASDLELHRSEPSYTIDTARMLRSQGHHNVFFLIGLDNVPQLPRWREPAALMREVQFLVMRRPSADLNWDDIQEPFRSLRQSMVIAPLIEISATDIRRRVKEGRPIDFLVPPSVANYIKERGLYR